ncbi:MAG TPA: MnhB domain-containing protein [Solirubrobacteraceae bacterium]|jgi:multicomponent Na+:H+ antiporter subunit B|nr:MnhB domain-containing protein [Solirubrobacteraceae bacterium]
MTAADSRGGGPEPEGLHRPARAAVLAGCTAACLVVALVGVPRERAGLPAVAREALRVAEPHWHIDEPVNEVVYGTRGFDTFGETFLLLAAVVSVTTLTRRRENRADEGGEQGEQDAGRREQAEVDPSPGVDADESQARSAEAAEQSETPASRGTTYPDDERLGSPGPERADAMSVVTRTAARTAAPMLAVAGVYLAAEGYSPGGGFPAGAVMLGVILLLWAGFGHERLGRAVRPQPLESLELAGAIAIIAIEALGLAIKGSVSANWLPLARSPTTILSGGVLQAFSGSELVEVSTGLTLAVFSLIAMRHDWAPDEEDEGDDRDAAEAAA